jgi:hypothetical protein
MGLMQRRKGRAYEQRVADAFRKAFPFATVRRSSQADRAHAPDVRFEDGPTLLRELWLECQDSRNPTPVAKLEQAERDILDTYTVRLPVAVWHRTHERDSWCTMRLELLRDLVQEGIAPRGVMVFGHPADDHTVTVRLETFIAIVTAALRKRGEWPEEKAA